MPDSLPLLRWTSLIEAVSYVVLLGIAMPLKYAAGMPLAVSVCGMIHGVLFMLLVWFLLRARFEKSWPTGPPMATVRRIAGAAVAVLSRRSRAAVDRGFGVGGRVSRRSLALRLQLLLLQERDQVAQLASR